MQGGLWKAVVTSITGKYSLQARLAGTVKEVTGIIGTGSGQTIEGNYCKQVEDLKKNSWYFHEFYMVQAIVAHEEVHKDHFEQCLEDVGNDIELMFEELSVPNTGQTSTVAIAQIKALPAYNASLIVAKNLWITTLFPYIDINHNGNNHDGPAYDAEATVTTPMANTICTHAQILAWGICVHCN